MADNSSSLCRFCGDLCNSSTFVPTCVISDLKPNNLIHPYIHFRTIHVCFYCRPRSYRLAEEIIDFQQKIADYVLHGIDGKYLQKCGESSMKIIQYLADHGVTEIELLLLRFKQ